MLHVVRPQDSEERGWARSRARRPQRRPTSHYTKPQVAGVPHPLRPFFWRRGNDDHERTRHQKTAKMAMTIGARTTPAATPGSTAAAAEAPRPFFYSRSTTHLLEGVGHGARETAEDRRSAVELVTVALERVRAAPRDGVALAHGHIQPVLWVFRFEE